jgi:hypothetical protein
MGCRYISRFDPYCGADISRRSPRLSSTWPDYYPTSANQGTSSLCMACQYTSRSDLNHAAGIKSFSEATIATVAPLSSSICQPGHEFPLHGVPVDFQMRPLLCS